MVAATQRIEENSERREHRAGEQRRGPRLGLLDIGVLVGAILVFMLFLLLLIRVVFPQGARLSDLSEDRSLTTNESEARGEVGLLSRGAGSLGGFLARLTDVQRDVKIRPADSVAWRSARLGSTVRNRDAVQTFANSRARVDFTEDNELRIGQNSLVVFSSGAADPFLQRRDPAVVLMGGDLDGAVNADYGPFAVQFANGVAELSADGQSSSEVRFRLGINPDNTSTIAIYAGQANVRMPGGQYLVNANQGLTVSADGSSAELAELPAVPFVRAPADGAVARFLATPPRIDFRWGQVRRATRYRIEIAADPTFDEIVVDELLTGTSFTHANLASGEYYWRVSARSGWSLGPASMPRRFRVVQDSAPPALDITAIDPLGDGRYVLRGRTARNATVRVLGAVIQPGRNGAFEHVFQPRPGTQTIVVEAIDAVGNTAYSSQVLHVPGRTGRGD